MGVYPEQILDLSPWWATARTTFPGSTRSAQRRPSPFLAQYRVARRGVRQRGQAQGQAAGVYRGRQGQRDAVETACDPGRNVPVVFSWKAFAAADPTCSAWRRSTRNSSSADCWTIEEEVPSAEASYRLVMTRSRTGAVADGIRSKPEWWPSTRKPTRSRPSAQTSWASPCPFGQTRPSTFPSCTPAPSDADGAAAEQWTKFPGARPHTPGQRHWLKLGHNLKFDRKILMKYGFEIESPSFDTLLASYLLNPDKRGHGLKELAGTCWASDDPHHRPHRDWPRPDHLCRG